MSLEREALAKRIIDAMPEFFADSSPATKEEIKLINFVLLKLEEFRAEIPVDGQPLSDYRIWDIADAVWRYKSVQTERAFERHFAHQVIAAALHELNRQILVPKGWKLVPIEPDEAMTDAAQQVWHKHPARHVWDAMIAVSPALPAAASGEPKLEFSHYEAFEEAGRQVDAQMAEFNKMMNRHRPPGVAECLKGHTSLAEMVSTHVPFLRDAVRSLFLGRLYDRVYIEHELKALTDIEEACKFILSLENK